MQESVQEIVLKPATVSLVEWRAIYRGARVRLIDSSYPVIEASARAVEAIIARDLPVYGINTGFGKLAHVRIATEDLSVLQRNIVLSHAAGVGAKLPDVTAPPPTGYSTIEVKAGAALHVVSLGP